MLAVASWVWIAAPLIALLWLAAWGAVAGEVARARDREVWLGVLGGVFFGPFAVFALALLPRVPD